MTPYVCSIKKSIKRATWQIKDGPNHELVPMHGMQLHLDEAVAALGGDNEDPHSVWDFVYHTEALPNFSFLLERTERAPGGTLEYAVLENRLGTETRALWLPARLLSVYPSVPSRLWLRIEKSWADRPIFLSPYQE